MQELRSASDSVDHWVSWELVKEIFDSPTDIDWDTERRQIGFKQFTVRRTSSGSCKRMPTDACRSLVGAKDAGVIA